MPTRSKLPGLLRGSVQSATLDAADDLANERSSDALPQESCARGMQHARVAGRYTPWTPSREAKQQLEASGGKAAPIRPSMRASIGGRLPTTRPSEVATTPREAVPATPPPDMDKHHAATMLKLAEELGREQAALAGTIAGTINQMEVKHQDWVYKVNEVKFYESLVQELQQELQEVKREAEDAASQSALMMQDAEQSFLGRQMGLEEKLQRCEEKLGAAELQLSSWQAAVTSQQQEKAAMEQALAGMQRSIAAWEVLAEEACSKAAAAEDQEQQLTQRLTAQEQQIKDLSSLVAMKDAALADVIAQKSSLAVSTPPTQLQQLAQLEGQLGDQQCEVEQLQARWRQSQEEHDSRVSELTACIAVLREDQQDLEARLTTSQAETEILQQHAAGLRAAAELAGQERRRLEQQVAAQQLTLDHLNTAITETKAHLQATLEQLAGREAATAQATEAALEQQRQGEQLSATLQRRCGQLEALRRQKEEVEEQLERQGAEMHMLRQQVALLHHRHAASTREASTQAEVAGHCAAGGADSHGRCGSQQDPSHQAGCSLCAACREPCTQQLTQASLSVASAMHT
ncbi:M20/M25/M40 family metallo-hydrolase [Haematococcus lacustris]|uniref:M20/M25/M40 family metallo-hydrolase n=1 Tax=Haematococcus lacustris TaxID=44745 RepID=A0A699ZJ28_HAELA|nr:M20/M25/M40 family metallo-hydrolase [Haematococcus lacustris]